MAGTWVPSRPTQTKPAATTDTPVYTCGAGRQAALSIKICNSNNADGTFKLWVAPLGVDPSPVVYDYDDHTIRGKTHGFNTFEILTGMTVQSGDVVKVNCSNADMSVVVYAEERFGPDET